MKYIIQMTGLIGWECANCKKSISSVIKNNTVYPVSGYWNIKRQEVYCSAECIITRHEGLHRV